MALALGAISLASGIASAIEGPPEAHLAAPGWEETLARNRARRENRLGFDQDKATGREFNALSPTLYGIAGISGDWKTDPALQGKVDAGNTKLTSLNQRLSTTKKGNGRLAAIRRNIKGTTKQLQKDQNNLASAPLQGSNFKAGPLGDATDQEINKRLGDRALNALKTGQSDDPRLNREIDEQQAQLEAGLASRGLAGSSAGITAMATFNQRKQESLADFARQDVNYETMKLGNEKSLADIAGSRLNLAMMPLQSRMGVADNFRRGAASQLSEAQMYQSERIAKMDADVAAAGQPNGFGKIANAAGVGAMAAGGSTWGATADDRIGSTIGDYFNKGSRFLNGYSQQGPWTGKYGS